MAGSTLLFSEVLDRVHKAKTKDQKVQILKDNSTNELRMLLKSSFDPNIKWCIPEGKVPYLPNDAPAGTEHTVLALKLVNFGISLWVLTKQLDNLKKNICLFRYVKDFMRVRQNYSVKQRIKTYTEYIKVYHTML